MIPCALGNVHVIHRFRRLARDITKIYLKKYLLVIFIRKNIRFNRFDFQNFISKLTFRGFKRCVQFTKHFDYPGPNIF